MNVSKITEIYNLFQSNEEAAKRLSTITDPNEACKVLAEYGIEVSIEELAEIVTSMHSDEIPVELLDLVAGGGKAARDFFRGFCDGVYEAISSLKWW